MATVLDVSGNTPLDRTIMTPNRSGRTDVFEYMYANDITNQPSSGGIRFNAVPTNTATLCRISKVLITSIDVALSLRYRLVSGKTIAVHDKDDSTFYTIFTIKATPAIVELANSFEIPVQLTTNGLEIKQQRVLFVVV